MHTPEGFSELLLLLLIAVGAATVFLRLKLPAVLGYLLVGIAAGPTALGLVADSDTIRSLAELGVVLLLFTIGLEFSLPVLARMRGALLGLGGGEVVISAGLTFAFAVWLGVEVPGALVLAGVVAMSSTALVTKQLTDQLELNAPHGRAALGVLLFQDIAVVPFLVVISGLAQPGEGHIWITLAESLGKGVLAILVILAVGRFVLRPALAGIAALHSGELFTLTALAVALGAAWWTALLGLSPALGAFVAGMMLGESAYRHTIEAEIRPFRDVLLAFFFVSVGMLLDLSIMVAAWPWVLLLLSALVVLKFVLVLGLCRVARMTRESSLRTALVLAHGGEFGFALLTLGLTHGLLPQAYGQVVLSALLLSMALAPLALRFNGALAALILPRAVESGPATSSLSMEQYAGHVLLVGFGRVGQHVTRLLDEVGIRWHALDSDPVRVENARASGAPVTHGDGTKLDVLRAAGLERARGLVLTMDDPTAAEPVVRAARGAMPDLPILVRARDDGHLAELQAAGATEVVPETLEAGLMVGSHLLLLLGMTTGEVEQRVRMVRHGRYSLLQALYPGADDWNPDALELRAVEVPSDARAVGREISRAGLDKCGVSVVSLVRDEQRLDSPPMDTMILGGDTLILSGTAGALDRGEAQLVRA